MPEPRVIVMFNTIIAIGGVLIGAGIAWGMLRAWRDDTNGRLKKIEDDVSGITGTLLKPSPFVWRLECQDTMEEVKQDTKLINVHLEKQDGAIVGLQNWARHEMEKEGLDVAKINSILNGRAK